RHLRYDRDRRRSVISTNSYWRLWLSRLNLAVASTGGHRRLPCAREPLPGEERHALSSLTSRVATPPASSRSCAIALSTARRSAGVRARKRTSSRARSSWRGVVRAVCLQASSVLRASGNRASILLPPA